MQRLNIEFSSWQYTGFWCPHTIGYQNKLMLGTRKRTKRVLLLINVSLIKTRCRASRRGEVFSPVGVRLPNPYENVHLCLEFAIYQTHVIN